MPEAFWQALNLPGVEWVMFGALVAGIVRGFSGFGTALIFLPIAAQFLSPVWAVIAMATMDVFGPIPAARRAWRDCHKLDLRRLLLATFVTVPLGVMILRSTDPEIYRYAISIIALLMLVLLISGYRYQGQVTPKTVYGIGGAAGFMGGVAGLPGPFVILFYMASPHKPSAIRANTFLYLWGFDIMLLTALAIQGALAPTMLWLGLMLVVPTFLGITMGSAIFNPDKEKVYRNVAYLVIAASAVSGLPFWS